MTVTNAWPCLELRVALLIGVLGIACPGNARAEEPALSISGYDPVSYFTDGRPVLGKPDFEYVWHKLRWRFASSEHRDMFAGAPQRYAPQYDGYCAMGAAADDKAHKDIVDPLAWRIVDGRLFLLHNGYWLEQWQANARDYIKRADADWRAVEDLPAPTVVGAPCAASPPTTSVVLRDGRRWLMVGEQVSRDESGRLVGKGDMRAQVEQVGRNVVACLHAGGASASSVVFTISQVAAPEAFAENAALMARYVGPPGPASSVVQRPQLSDPDYLLQVEAVAALK
jgi:enamine deaminase RidA (YjgF/YER057c/UK114 family)